MLSNFSGNVMLSTAQLLDGLSAEEVNLLLRSGVTQSFRKGEVIFREGGIPTGIYCVKEGNVKTYKVTAEGREQIISIASQGELFGYHSVFTNQRYPKSAATLVSSQIMFIPKETFVTTVQQSTVLLNRLVTLLSNEFTLHVNNFTTLATKTVRARLAFNLLLLEEKFRKPGSQDVVDIYFSRMDLANMIGTANETLVRLLKDFRQKKLVETTSVSIRLLDREGILAEANFVAKDPGRKKQDEER